LLCSCGNSDIPTSSTTVTSSGVTSSSIASSSVISSSSSSSEPTTSIAPAYSKVQLEHNIKEYINNNFFELSSSPYKGDNVKTLVLPIWFNDSNTYIDESKKDNIINDLKDVFNTPKTSLGWYSVSSYYEQESFGKLKLNGVVADWYESGESYLKYANDYYSLVEVIYYATENYFSDKSLSERRSFDQDGDGYLDSVTAVYGCPDSRAMGSSEDYLWAFTSWLGNDYYKNVSKPGINVFMWCSYDFMYDSATALDRTGFAYGDGDTSITRLDSHTFIHEFGHVLGIEDYYDYSYQYSPAAGFSMQDYNVGGHDPYSTLLWEWSSVYKPIRSTSITINDFQSSHDIILLANHDVTSVFDEYFLLELYTPTGLNQMDAENAYCGRYPTGSESPGIRLWHVDSRLVYSTTESGSFRYSKRTTDPTCEDGYGVYYMMSNSYNQNGSVLGSSYYNYNILQLIHNDDEETYKPTGSLSAEDLFTVNDEFDLETYQSQFYKGNKMNDGNSFNWSFKVKAIDSKQATIEITLNDNTK